MNIQILYQTLDISAEVTHVTWAGELNQPYRTLDITCIKAFSRYRMGKEIQFFVDGNKLFQGVIFSVDGESDGTVTLKAYDRAIYLLKNADSRKFVNQTATQIIQTLCQDFQIPIGTLVNTGYIIPKMILRNHTLWDMILMALTKTSDQTGKKYWAHFVENALQLETRNAATYPKMVEENVNLMKASARLNIEDMRNQVKVIREGSPTVVIPNVKQIQDFGLMQKMEEASEKENLNQLGAAKLKEAGMIADEYTLSVLGDIAIFSGKVVYVHQESLQIQGAYFITHDTHTFSANGYTLDLTISQTDELPKLVYEEPEEKKEAVTKKVATKKVKKTKKNEEDGGDEPWLEGLV